MDLSQAKVLFDAAQMAGQLEAMARAISRRENQIPDLVPGGHTHGWGPPGPAAGRFGGPPDRGRSPDTGDHGHHPVPRRLDHLQHSRPKVGTTDISFDIQGRRVVLVDDVLYTGRTVRAALDELMDFGRARVRSNWRCS